MGVLSEATKAIKDFKNKNKYPYKKEAEWEDSDLNKLKKNVEAGAKWDKEHSKSGWTNPQTGDKFSAEHYKDNYETDRKAIQRVKDEIKKKNAANIIKKRASNASYTSDKMSRKLKKRDKVDDYLES